MALERSLRITRTLSVVVVLAASIALAGCASQPSTTGSTDKSVWGFVASPADAQLEIDTAKSSTLSLIADRVVAPVQSWLVVYANDNGSLGKVLGYAPVPKGESSNRIVMFDDGAPRDVFVLLHADTGTLGTFEFDPENKEQSADRPIFVNGAELAQKVSLVDYGVKTTASQASIKVWRQGAITSTLTVGEVVAPSDGWVVVHLDEKGVPGRLLGQTWVKAGRSTDITVALSPHPSTGGMWVVLHADRGKPKVFEYTMADEVGSADQSFVVDGKEVLSKVPLYKPAGM